MKEWFNHGARVGIFLALLFIVGYIWYWLRPGHQMFFENFVQYMFFGFRGMDLGSFFLGIIQSFAWGIIGAGLWVLSGRKSSRKKR